VTPRRITCIWKAGTFAHRAVVIDPSFWIGYLHLGQAFEQSGQIDSGRD
jgi:hypothetical protein